MSVDTEIYLNQLAQGIHPIDDGLAWFQSQDDAGQRLVVRVAGVFAIQAGAWTEDVLNAIAQSGLKPTFTPCVMIQSGRLSHQISEFTHLPQNELPKAFRLLISLFAIADARRRASCGPSCRHWWHRNLADPVEVAEIRRKWPSL